MADQAVAEKSIRQHVIWAVGAGLVPIPLADFVAVTAIQLDLIRQLCTQYGITYQEGQGKVWVSALTGGAIARIGASAIKAIPGIGTLLGGLSMSIASGASTYAVGQVVLHHLASGGTLSNLNMDAAKARYAEAYEKGKDVAKEASSAKQAAAGDVAGRLEKLAELKAKGLVSEAEYDAKKAELLAQL